MDEVKVQDDGHSLTSENNVDVSKDNEIVRSE